MGADDILKKVKVVESKCMNNEVTLEELDKNLRQTIKMASDNEQKLDELNRKLGVQEEELQMVGENMKQLEMSAEKAVEREEKLKDKITNIQQKFKAAEGRYEYGR